jgi:alpha-glucosidase
MECALAPSEYRRLRERHPTVGLAGLGRGWPRQTSDREQNRPSASQSIGDAADDPEGDTILFAGDELGLEQVTIAPECIRDPFEKLVPGFGLNRDPERAPMRWDDSRAAGFTTGEPWLPMGENVRDRNVEKLQADDLSLLWLYKRLIGLRQTQVALVMGEYVPVRSRNDVLLYKRVWDSETVLVALNVVDQPRKLEWNGEGVLVLSTYLDGEGTLKSGPFILRANEGIILKL